MRALLAAALLAFAVTWAPAREVAGRRAFCQENAKLDFAAFEVVHTPDAGGAPTSWTFIFSHCAWGGRAKSLPMEVQRHYEATGGQGFGLTTQLGSKITSARLYSSKLTAPSAEIVTAELGPFFTRDLLDGGVVDAGKAAKGTVTIRLVKAPSAP